MKGEDWRCYTCGTKNYELRVACACGEVFGKGQPEYPDLRAVVVKALLEDHSKRSVGARTDDLLARIVQLGNLSDQLEAVGWALLAKRRVTDRGIFETATFLGAVRVRCTTCPWSGTWPLGTDELEVCDGHVCVAEARDV